MTIIDGVDLSDFDIYHVGVSGGKDSCAALLWAVHDSGWPKEKIRATFCDTGNEHEFTYQHLAMLSERVHSVETIKPPLDFYELAKKKHRFPSVRARFCTLELKIFPTQDYIRSLQVDGARVLAISGVRAQESRARSLLPELEWDGTYSTDVYRPLLRWTLDAVWAYLDKHGIERNKLYDYGARRVGCFPCIMSNKAEIRNIVKHFPERIDRIRDAEAVVGADRRDGNGIATFFARDKTPERFRSKQITTESGEVMFVPTIDDVAAWSLTPMRKRTGQYEFDFDDREICSSKFGHCE